MWRIGVGAGALLLSLTPLAAAGDGPQAVDGVGFRVETDVFFGDQAAPQQQSKTLFLDGVAFDISLNDPNVITMVDPARQRIALLNQATRTRSEVDLRQLHEYIDSARKQAEASGLAVFLRGATQVAQSDGEVRVGDAALLYQATVQRPPEERMAVEYAQVADALVLLNGWRSGVPPFARLQLNQTLASMKSLPSEITRTSRADDQALVVRSKLHANWRLSRDDQDQIAEVERMLNEFQEVPATQFFAAKP